MLKISDHTGEYEKPVREQKWKMKAAELGNAEAQYEVGRAYKNKKDMSQAVYWYEKAAEQNYRKALTALWAIYYDTEDRAAYARWTAKICELDNSDATFMAALGLLADEANALSRNGSYTLGYQIMRPIAEYAYKTQDRRYAQTCALIGADYVNGYGVAKDRNEGKKWLQRALDMGFEPAREILAKL